MPGVKSIVWNEANDVKMLHALLYYGNISVDRKVADQIAEAMGPNVPAKAILSHITLVKKRFKDAGGNVVRPAGTKRAPTMKATGRATKRSTTTVIKKEDEIDSNNSEDFDDRPVTPPETPANKINVVTSKNSSSQEQSPTKRSSPRGASAKNYNYLNDPFIHMADTVDEDGEKVFEEDDGASSEDSAMSDAGFEDVEGAGLGDDGEVKA